MIKQLLFYNLRYYSRSHKFIVPLVIYLAMFAVLYSIKPLGVMSTYAMTSMMTFIIAVLVAYSFMEIEDPVQQQIALLSLRNDNMYYFSKVLFVWIIISIMSFVVVLYPSIFGFFDRSVKVSDFIVAMVGHIFLALLGVCVSALFNSRLFKNRQFAILTLIIVVLISVVQKAIITKYPASRWGLYVLPPVSFVVDKMTNFEGLADLGFLLLAFASSIAYSFIILVLFIKLMKVKIF
ncbi:hypothetical protein RBH29_07300 [Herbivorax sp. ANBcel31]|uniref:hypothetical protein n=1 Tax=Herbivorax sp. ANBcel31 TaxID=3069754 RepID=UPI0027B57AD9|nr:hypothetical protein [Herbivorax sp. ANBcel31]MDQ2086234.1 hypothetical protein [Herbivorax sp. ANBcel31]